LNVLLWEGEGNLYRVVNAKKLINRWLVAMDLSTLEDPRVGGTSIFTVHVSNQT